MSAMRETTPRPLPEREVRPPLLWIEHSDQLRALERDWKQLTRQLPAPNPFLSWEWAEAWLRSQPRLRPLIVAASFGDGSLAGLLPLQRRWRRGLRQIEFLGQGSGGDDLDCLLHPLAPERTTRMLIGAVLAFDRKRRGRHRWDVLRLEAIGAGGALDRTLAQCSGARPEPGDVLPFLRLPRRMEDLLKAHSGNFRSEVRRRRRRFAREVPDAFLQRATSPAEISTALDQLFRLHNLRRSQKGGRGIFESESLRRFHRRVALQLASRGVDDGPSCVYLLRTPGRAIAALYGFESGRRFLYFQSGFDPAWTALSPGTVLLAEVIENCIERGMQRFEFLRGEETYKARWCVERRQARNWLTAGSARGRLFLRLRARLRRRAEGKETGSR